MMVRSETNRDVKELAARYRIFNYEIAAELGISVPTLTNRMRRTLDPETKKQMIDAIKKLARERQQA